MDKKIYMFNINVLVVRFYNNIVKETNKSEKFSFSYAD